MILYPTKFKKNNLGDVLINVILIKELLKDHRILMEDEIPSEFREQLTVDEISRIIVQRNWLSRFVNYPVVHWLALLPSLSKIKYSISVPGHHKVTNDITSYIRTAKDIFKLSILNILGIKSVRLGVTIDVEKGFAMSLFRVLSKSYHAIGIREGVNYADLSKAGIKNCILMDDLAVMLYDPKELKDLNYENSKTVTLSFRGGLFGSKVEPDYTAKVLTYVKAILMNDFFNNKAFVICHQVEEDAEVSSILYEALKDTYPCTLQANIMNMYDANILYRKSNCVLTNRLHVGLLAIVNGCPAYVITDLKKHTKIVNVFNELGLGNLLHDLESNFLNFSPVQVNFAKIEESKHRNEKIIAGIFR